MSNRGERAGFSHGTLDLSSRCSRIEKTLSVPLHSYLTLVWAEGESGVHRSPFASEGGFFSRESSLVNGEENEMIAERRGGIHRVPKEQQASAKLLWQLASKLGVYFSPVNRFQLRLRGIPATD